MAFTDIELPSNRKFGFFFAAVFAIVGAYLFIKDSLPAGFLVGALAAVFFLITLINANILLPLNKLWMKFGLLLGKIVNPIVMGIIFFGLFMPISLFMKLFGRDELCLKISTQASYWKERDTDAIPADSFKDQF